LNWIVPNKILAFAGPSYERQVSPEGYCTLSPSDYIPYFLQKNVGLVVRLNKKMYHEQDFVDAGIQHVEAFFLDGSCPSREILDSVLDAFEKVPADKAFAVHCKAGLGRTGSCIGAYLMKHFGFTAKEAIAWMRICRPGCVIGPQQQYLEKMQRPMWELGVAEGYIEMPNGTTNTNSSPTVVNNNHNKINNKNNINTRGGDDAEMSEAVIGREGQAEGLLAARSRRANTITDIANMKNSPLSSDDNNREKLVSASITTSIPPTPTTPDTKNKPHVATVTPEHAQGNNNINNTGAGAVQQSAALWCG
jgi:protein-tyrosine phosphatase